MSADPAELASLPAEAREIVRLLELAPLPHEGGFFRNTLASEHSSAIYYLLAAGDFSALHRLNSPEVYHWYAGSALNILVLHPDGSTSEHRLGPDLAAGERPQLIVPADCWHGSAPAGSWTLVGTTMAPPFSWDGFELGSAEELSEAYPAVRDVIHRLTRA